MGYCDFEPLHYDLEFEPDLERSVFSGKASIRARCTGSPARTIEMDCAEMTVHSCRVRVVRQKGARGRLHTGEPVEIPRSSLSINEKKERLVIRLPRNVALGGDAGGREGGRRRAGSLRSNARDRCRQVIIELGFDGVLNDRLLGFYRSRYGGDDNNNNNGGGKKTSYMATTQFEASDARRAFPCWDVPSAKATFGIRITVPDSRYSAVSNMPVSQVRRDPLSARRTFHFATTPIMSTYLVYLGVGEFAYVEDPGDSGRGKKRRKGEKGEGTIIRVITTKHVDRRLARFALKCARTLLGLYESYFGIAYPLPKLDLIAVPDFAAGAMENWGAITFRENLLLYDPKKSSTRTKQLVAEVISHELAHQWFGNLVTMKWWNDLWLNESFATFMATKLLDRMYPEWDMWGQFLTDTMRTGMDLDSMRSTHPIDVEVASPSQIREIFDPISYDKGGCVLRMLEQYVGGNSFKKGLRLYLRKFKYGNAEGADLWRCIEAESGKPVSRMVRSWLTIPGFPVVHLSLKGNGSKLHARQERYVSYSGRKRPLSLSSSSSDSALAPPSRGSAGAPDASWPIPLSLRHVPGGSSASTVLFSRKTIRVDLDAAGAKPGAGRAATNASTGKTRGTTRAIIANPGRTGFYRVRYDGAMMLDMFMLADSGRLGDSDLWALQNDLFAMCVSGLASMRDYLELLDAYRNVDAPVVLADVGLNLSRLFRMSFDSPLPAGEIGWHATEFYRRVHDLVGWRFRGGEPHTVSLLRGPVITSLGLLGDRGVVERCMDMYDALSASGGAPTRGTIHPDLVDPVCTVAAWNSSRRGSSRRGSSSSTPASRRETPAKMHGRLVALYRAADTTEQKMRFLGAMCGFGDPALLERTLKFALSGEVRSQNFFAPVLRISENPYGSRMLWTWIQKNWPLVSEKVGHGNPLLGRVISSLANVCGRGDIPDVRRFFSKNSVPGTERTVMQTIERIRIADAMRERMKREFAGTGAGTRGF